jgi:hypothetical protein
VWLIGLFIVADGWVVIQNDGRHLIEQRLRPDGLMEMRGSTHTDVTAAAIAHAFWYPKGKLLPQVKQRLVLKHEDKEKVIYIQLRVPVVKDRDYTLHIDRFADPQNGLYQFSNHCVTDVGPPENAEHVRVKDCKSVTTIETQADGRTLVSYEGYANPGGALPKWIVNMLAPRAAAEILDRLIAEGRELQATARD